jgi:maltooligosyltrehalose trehalohydrolase
MLWNDDWHHSAFVALTGRREAYYTPYAGRAQEFVSAAKHGTLYQGQVYFWQRQRRGTPALDVEPARFVHFLQNHDQIANTTLGVRCHTIGGAARHRAITALLLLGPQTPMLFQGQEFSSSAPFHYFADQDPELAEKVEAGRRDFISQFPSSATPEVQRRVPAPHYPATFEACKLDFAEREQHHHVLEMHRDLLRLRREDSCLTKRPPAVDGAVLAEHAFVLRFFGAEGDDRLLVVNVGHQLSLPNAPEPLLAPPEGMRWRLLWSSEDPRYGGLGTPLVDSEEAGWQLLPDSAVLLAPEPVREDQRHRPDRRRKHERRAVPTPFA